MTTEAPEQAPEPPRAIIPPPIGGPLFAETESLEPRDDGSCDLHKNHGASHPLRLVRHWVFPRGWQVELTGAIDNADTIEVCDNGNYAIQIMLHELRDAARLDRDPVFPARIDLAERKVAEQGWALFVAARGGSDGE